MTRVTDILSKSKLPLPILCIYCMLMMLPTNSHALEWKDLWQTPDQQAQKAFQQQQYEQAAEQFEQSEWKAAAQYKAGQYQQVLDTLKDTQTSEGFYNQGNAYVKQGKLQEALESFNKSLEIDPKNADAKFNKELIEKEQKKQQQDQGEGDSENQEQQDSSDSKNKDGEQGGDQPNADKDQKESEGREDNQQDEANNDSETKSEQAENQQQESDKATEDAQTAKPSEEETGEEDAEASAVEQANAPKDESEQASEQWLKRIPDDPAGLLKRKFEYQYKQRPRDSRNQQENW